MSKSILIASIEPEHRAELAVVSSRKLNRQLRLADSAKSVKHKDLLSLILPLWQEGLLELGHLGRSVYKCLHYGNAFKTKIRSIFSNICV